jgi:cytochrome c peroxidase
MHNGVFASLEEVLDFYNEGGGLGNGLNVPNQTLGSHKLNLTPLEKENLIAFLKSLQEPKPNEILEVLLPKGRKFSDNRRIRY